MSFELTVTSILAFRGLFLEMRWGNELNESYALFEMGLP